ncbi:hypothetical protein [Leisingera sp. McT4-56]|uniref:hypothetical protein n=1 Tax=Leisingera sp. McT4-56 TaxID=2881255 RepID=UPI001CF8D637|nr:hypothetical protein [Leisingera sp. McT4-56]MCB4454940.1 hypothetical protein [Leisingera sp. McT4-56]
MFKKMALMLALICPATASAKPEKFLCTFGNGRSYASDFTKFLSNHAVFVMDAENGTATAYDSYVHLMHQSPIPARFKKKGDGKYQLRWKLVGVPVEVTRSDRDGSTRIYDSKVTFRYSFLFDPATKQGFLSARGGGKSFKTTARMSCEETNRNIVFQTLQPV